MNGQGNSKKAKIFGVTLCAMLLALCTVAEAQQPKKLFRIGYLSSVDPAMDLPRAEGIRRALRERNYIEGQNIASSFDVPVDQHGVSDSRNCIALLSTKKLN